MFIPSESSLDICLRSEVITVNYAFRQIHGINSYSKFQAWAQHVRELGPANEVRILTLSMSCIWQMFAFFFLQVIKVYSEDETSRALEVPSDITARDLCQLLILKNHYVDDHSWTLFEHLTCLGLGKCSFREKNCGRLLYAMGQGRNKAKAES